MQTSKENVCIQMNETNKCGFRSLRPTQTTWFVLLPFRPNVLPSAWPHCTLTWWRLITWFRFIPWLLSLFRFFFVLLSENRAGPSNLGNVISQILLCKQFTPDFNEEELCSITKDSQDIAVLLAEMQEYMPQHEAYLGECSNCAGSRTHRVPVVRWLGCLHFHCRALWYLAKARRASKIV